MQYAKLNETETLNLESLLQKVNKLYNMHFMDVLLQKPKTNAYLFGGAVRNAFDNKDFRDIDIIVTLEEQDTETRNRQVIEIIKPFVEIIMDWKFNEYERLYRVIPYGSQLSRPIDLNVKQNLDHSFCDFTVNDLYLDLRTTGLIDRFNGLEDLRNRILKTILKPEIEWAQNPNAIFRVLKIAAKNNLEPTLETLESISEHMDLGKKVLDYIYANRNDWLSEIYLECIFSGLKYDAKKWWDLLYKTKLFESCLDFINEKSGKAKQAYIARDNFGEELKEATTLEDRISLFLEEITRLIYPQIELKAGFNNVKYILALDTPLMHGELEIDTAKIKLV